jgi:predicted phosphodiesterase
VKFFRSFVIVVWAIALIGCAGVSPNIKVQASKQVNPWTNLNLYNNPDNFHFAIVSDLTGGYRQSVFEDAVKKLNLLKPEFVMSVGDLIEGRSRDDGELNRQWDQFDGFVNKLQMPFFYVPGNHDIGDEIMAQKWHQRLGPSYYHFVYRNVLFLCVNTEDPPTHNISDQQIEYFRKVLKANSNVRWTLIFMHQPTWKGETVLKNWLKFESLLADRSYTVFAGHHHTYSKAVRNGQRYYTLATTGGSGDGEGGKPAGLAECQFDHIAWLTMTEDGPVMANLLLESIFDDEPCLQQ